MTRRRPRHLSALTDDDALLGAVFTVAASTGIQPSEWKAEFAPSGSVHDGVVYVFRRDPADEVLDDQVTAVLPSGEVRRLVAVGNPIHPPTPLTSPHFADFQLEPVEPTEPLPPLSSDDEP